MAEVTVRIEMHEEFTVDCDGSDADEVLEDIAGRERLNEKILSYAYDNMTVVSAQYDEVEQEAEDEDEDLDEEDEEAEEEDFGTTGRY